MYRPGPPRHLFKRVVSKALDDADNTTKCEEKKELCDYSKIIPAPAIPAAKR
jgi:hypothetical protein